MFGGLVGVIKGNYNNPLSYLTGGPGWWNGAMAAGESFGGLVSSHLRDEATRKANEQNMAMRREEIALQREFAQNGIRWRMEDAKAAGIHPLAALGASGASYTSTAFPMQPETGAAETMANMGQGITRAIQNTRTAEEQEMTKLQLASARADLDGKVIDNQIRASQLQKIQNPAVGPGLPSAAGGTIAGQRQAVKVKPSEVYASQKPGSAVQSGMINTLQYTREASGGIGIAPSADAKERLEDDFVGESLWHLKNRISPPPPPPELFPLPEGQEWKWSATKQEFYPAAKRYPYGRSSMRQDRSIDIRNNSMITRRRK